MYHPSLPVPALILLLSFVFTAQSLCAQLYNFSHYTNKDGLSQNHCTSLLQDRRGKLWIGTSEGGVCQFDGHHFKIFDTHKGLSSNFTTGIAEDNQGNIWISTTNGLNKFDGNNISSFLDHTDSPITISSLSTDDEHNIWFLDNLGQISRLTRQLTQAVYHEEMDAGLTAYAFTEEHHLIYANHNGISMLNNNGDYLFKIPFNQKVNCLLQIHEGKWMVGTSQGLYVLENQQLTIPTQYKALSFSNINKVLKDSKGRVWVATAGHGVYCIKGNDTIRLSKENGLSQTVNDLLEDLEGGIWFATPDGIFRLNNFAFAFYNETHGAKEANVHSLTYGPNGFLYWTNSSHLQWLDSLNKIHSEPLPPKIQSSESPKLVADSTALWLITQHAVFRKSPHDKYWKSLNSSHQIATDETFTCGTIHHGTLYIGGNSGVYYFQNDSIYPFLSGISATSCMLKDKQNRLWVGSNQDGLYLINQDSSVHHYHYNNGLPSKYINTLLEDAKGNIWIGTSGNSLAKIPFNDPDKVVTYEEEEFISTNIYSLATDSYGHIWAGSDRGMNKVIILENDYIRIERYTSNEGFSTLEVSKDAGLSGKAYSWFGTKNGLTRINPNEDILVTRPPDIQFTGIDLFFENISLQEYAEGIESWSQMPFRLQLPYDMNHLTFHFSGISMNIPERVRYQWKLSGLDEDWSPPSDQSFAVYPNLEPGNYQFMVKARNARGKYNEIPAVYHFEIQKPFYATKLFLALSLVTIVISLYYLLKYRADTYEKTKLLLREKVNERTAELAKQSLELELKRKELQDKNAEMSRIHSKMVSSLQYAGRIQKVLLDCQSDFDRLIPQSFVLDVPKDIVTGDFYWLYESEEFTHFALIDCTNRGVPAAFISIVGKDYLQQIVSEKPELTPSQVLAELNEIMTNILQSGENKEINDGMDIAYCRFSKLAPDMLFAGARRPIIMVKNNQLDEIKGDFSSIGLNYNKKMAQFQDHYIRFDHETVFYLFSDGFANQFDKEGNRFKRTRFRKLLLENVSLPFDKQKAALEKTFINWKADAEQLDDMMVIGFKLVQN
ncbi:two-component regulator propeller domain-containing protein [Limibacter armeniacum]|uniref:two-component regulator propeller domain-containing protein n=1 Tax=Limibacter armeniacum TaxID=466084 RepID=UPI002FE66A61